MENLDAWKYHASIGAGDKGRVPEAKSAVPPSEPEGQCERSRLATGSLPVPGAEAFIARLRDRLEAARSLTKSPLDAPNRDHYEGVVWAWDDIMPELCHLLGLPTERQPEENDKDVARPAALPRRRRKLYETN